MARIVSHWSDKSGRYCGDDEGREYQWWSSGGWREVCGPVTAFLAHAPELEEVAVGEFQPTYTWRCTMPCGWRHYGDVNACPHCAALRPEYTAPAPVSTSHMEGALAGDGEKHQASTKALDERANATWPTAVFPTVPLATQYADAPERVSKAGWLSVSTWGCVCGWTHASGDGYCSVCRTTRPTFATATITNATK